VGASQHGRIRRGFGSVERLFAPYEPLRQSLLAAPCAKNATSFPAMIRTTTRCDESSTRETFIESSCLTSSGLFIKRRFHAAVSAQPLRTTSTGENTAASRDGQRKMGWRFISDKGDKF